MFYREVTNIIGDIPLRTVKNALKVLFTMGPGEFWIRTRRKARTGDAESRYDSGYVMDLSRQYQIHIEKNALTSDDLKRLSEEQGKFAYKPLISIVMPVYNVDEEYLIKAITSVKRQIYPHWELCICDDDSALPYIKPLLQRYSEEDRRIRVVYRSQNGGIVKSSNDALEMASGDYIGFLDNDDELTPDALFEVVKALQEKPYDLLYSDEDKLDKEGNRREPFFKPDWSPDLLLSINYICHFGVYRRELLKEINGFREGFDGSQDYDLILRFTEKTTAIKHIPKILYHWRKIPGSTAESIYYKPYAVESAKKALADALMRRRISGQACDGIWPGSYRVKRALNNQPLVSIIIPFKDQTNILQACLKSIFRQTAYKNFEILLVNNQSGQHKTRKYLEKIEDHPQITLLSYDRPFNFAAINNFAVQKARGEILILLNNDTEVESPDWIESMLEHAERPEVGAVGAKLLYPDDTLQHAGVLIGVGGVANHAFSCHNRNDFGYFGQAQVIRNYSAVTAACLMVRKSVYEEIGGLDEQNLAVAFNDVDFCLRLRQHGYLIVYTPYAILYHHESLSRGHDVNREEVHYMLNKYAELIQNGDPYYNPNLTRERLDFSLRSGDRWLNP